MVRPAAGASPWPALGPPARRGWRDAGYRGDDRQNDAQLQSRRPVSPTSPSRERFDGQIDRARQWLARRGSHRAGTPSTKLRNAPSRRSRRAWSPPPAPPGRALKRRPRLQRDRHAARSRCGDEEGGHRQPRIVISTASGKMPKVKANPRLAWAIVSGRS